MTAPLLCDRVRETCSAPGTGTVTLLGAVSGYQAFVSVFASASVVPYCMADQGGGPRWEIGTATFTTPGNTLTRSAANVLAGSSGAGTLVNFSSGTQDVFVDLPAAYIAAQVGGSLFFGTGTQAVTLSSNLLTSARSFSLPDQSGTFALTSAFPVSIANGGTGQTTQGNAILALLPALTGNSGKFVSNNGAAVLWSTAVTSVSGSGGTTGLTLTGGPITGTGTLTLGGTLAVANGGTGDTTGLKIPHAWVYFTVSGTTVTVQQSQGVSSVTRAGTGIYNINLSVALASANACVDIICDNLSGTGNLTPSVSGRSTTAQQVLCTLGPTTATDPSGVHVVIWGN